MNGQEVAETGNLFFRWLNEYGALACWAVYGMVSAVGWPAIIVYFIWRLGRPIANIADYLEELAEDKKL